MRRISIGFDTEDVGVADDFIRDHVLVAALKFEADLHWGCPFRVDGLL
jgi:hypothetical protein